MPGRGEAALWLLDWDSVPVDERFFEFAGWFCGGLKTFVKSERAAPAISRLPAGVRCSLKELTRLKERRLAEHFEELAEDSHRLAGVLLDLVRESPGKCAARKDDNAMTHRIQTLFGLDDEGIAPASMLFSTQAGPDISVLQNHLESGEYSNRHQAACMLGAFWRPLRRAHGGAGRNRHPDEDGDLCLTRKMENA